MKKRRAAGRLGLALPLCLVLQTAVADQYLEGYDLAMGGNYEVAYAKWLPMALAGDGRAQFNLGLMYHGGLHVATNEPTAVFWYIKAAENGIREALEYLVVGYREGWFGLPRDERQAAYWEYKLENESL